MLSSGEGMIAVRIGDAWMVGSVSVGDYGWVEGVAAGGLECVGYVVE